MRLKQLITIILVLGLSHAFAQKSIYHNKLSVGVGLFTLQEVDKVVSTLKSQKDDILGLQLDRSLYSPVYYAEFGGFLFNGLINLSINASYSKFTEDYVYIQGFNPQETSFDNNFYTLMMGTNVYFLGPRHLVELYSGVYVGAYANRTSNKIDEIEFREASEFAYHITIAGTRIGKDIGAHLEVGYGFLGIVNFGLSAQF